MQAIITQGIEYQQLLDDLRALIRHEMQAASTTAAVQQPVGDDLLTIKDAATMLGVSVATIHEWKRRAVLPFRKIGGRAYLSKIDVLAAGTQQQRTIKPSRTKSK